MYDGPTCRTLQYSLILTRYFACPRWYLNCLTWFFTMMTSSNGNIFCVTGHLCGEFTSHRWIPHTKASVSELWFFSLICAWINGWVNNGEAGDLRRHRAQYDCHCNDTPPLCSPRPHTQQYWYVLHTVIIDTFDIFALSAYKLCLVWKCNKIIESYKANRNFVEKC